MSTDVLASLTTETRQRFRSADRAGWDMILLTCAVALVGLGLVMLYSASGVMASQKLGDPLYLVRSQMLKVGLGMGLVIFALQVDYRWYRRLIYPILALSGLMLALVLIPGVGTVQNGARRWFSVAGMSFQPAEVVKLTVVFFLAYSVSKKGDRMGRFTTGFVPHLIIVGSFVALLMLQPDFGSSVILLTMMMLMLFVSGAKIAYLGLIGLIGAIGAYFAITGSAYRMKRILAFLDPWSYRTDIGYQISESLIAIGAGGLSGRGLGNGHGKLGYVPELWNDFIATIIAEELGIVGMVVLVALFVGILWRGWVIAHRATDDFGTYLAFGISVLFCLQGAANLCVVTGLLPTKGLTLPFVSFGGSSVMMSLFGIGVLLNISKNQPDLWELGRIDRESRQEDRRWNRKRKKILRNRERKKDGGTNPFGTIHG